MVLENAAGSGHSFRIHKRLSDKFVAPKRHELFLYITGVQVYESKQQ